MSFIVKNTTLPSLFDLLAPHSCRGCGHTGTVLCDRCKNDIISHRHNFCPHCKSPSPTGKCPKCNPLPPTFVVDYRTGLIDALIHDFKYNSVRALAAPLAEILHQALPATTDPTIIVPLPTISRHVRARGLDHTYLLAKHLTKFQPNSKVSRILIRNQNTVQVGSKRKDRLSQASTAYAIAPNTIVDPKSTYLLLDDVWTTGASMQAAVKKLRQAGVQNIFIAVLAVSNVD